MIEEERRRLYDLKLKAAQEVKAQWEEKKQRESNNYKSFNSLESEDSSVTSSDAPSEKETRWVLKVWYKERGIQWNNLLYAYNSRLTCSRFACGRWETSVYDVS